MRLRGASALQAADADRSAAAAAIGIVGTPFDPWLHALGLQWPDP